jgi:hypothetical protein
MAIHLVEDQRGLSVGLFIVDFILSSIVAAALAVLYVFGVRFFDVRGVGYGLGVAVFLVIFVEVEDILLRGLN